MTRENTSGGSGYDGLVMSLAFHWTTFDLASRLPGTWRHEIAAVAVEADFREFPRTPILSRESQDVEHIFRGRVDAADVRQYLPWLYRLYRERSLSSPGTPAPNRSWQPAMTGTASCSTFNAEPRCGSSA